MRSTMGLMPLSVGMMLRRAAAMGPHARLVGYTAAGRREDEPAEVDEWGAACFCYTGGTTILLHRWHHQPG